MPAAGPKRQLEPAAPQPPPKPSIYTREAAGLIVIAILVLILAVARYWHHIPWGAR